MGIPFLSEIEKLINEHGSAKILQERIALAKDQYEALEKELAASKMREADLAAEMKRLSLDNEQLNNQINNLNSENLLALKYGVYWISNGVGPSKYLQNVDYMIKNILKLPFWPLRGTILISKWAF